MMKNEKCFWPRFYQKPMASRISYQDCGLETPPVLTGNNRGFLPFPMIKTVTTVIISYFNQSVDLFNLFYFLKLGRLSFEDERKLTNGYIPEKTGTILKAKILIKKDKFYRGISDKKNPFKNAITMWISEGSKMVSARVSRTSIHMTGITSTKMAVFVSQLVFNHLESIEKVVQEMNSDMEKTDKIIKWILSNSKGDIISKTHFNRLKVPENYPDCIPEELDCDLFHRFVEIIPYFEFSFPHFLFFSGVLAPYRYAGYQPPNAPVSFCLSALQLKVISF